MFGQDNPFRVKRFSHHVVITGFDLRGKRLLDEFTTARLGSWNVYRKWDGSWERKLATVFAAARRDRKEYRFHINSWPVLEEFLLVRGIKPEHIIVEDVPLYEPVKVELSIKNGMEARDYQLPIIDYICTQERERLVRALLVILQTGKGKTAIALFAMVKLAVRTLIMLKPMYFDRWVDELRDTKKVKSTLGLEPGELILIRGSADLRKVLQMAVNGELKAKVIVISNKTMYNYIETYQSLNTVDGVYPVAPGDFFQTLGIGLRLIDEYHENFHLNFILDLYTHCPLTLQLSATMESDKPFINKMYALAIPPGDRFTGLAFDRYIVATAMYYQLLPGTRVSWTRRGRSSYSHTAFEESLMKNKPALERYTKMIVDIVKRYYISIMVPGQRMLIFASSVEFCGYLRDALRKELFGDLVINRYTAEESYNDLITADIAVSTLQSAGTAVDIPGLLVTLMTPALLSQQANEQALGRLRRLKMWPDVSPNFYYLVCRDIETHMRYDETKKNIFKDKVLSLKEIELSHKI